MNWVSLSHTERKTERILNSVSYTNYEPIEVGDISTTHDHT
jgi:hypothetical protein